MAFGTILLEALPLFGAGPARGGDLMAALVVLLLLVIAALCVVLACKSDPGLASQLRRRLVHMFGSRWRR